MISRTALLRHLLPLLPAALATAAAEPVVQLAPYAVTARQTDLPAQLPWSQLTAAPAPLSAQPLDEQLRALPGFNLFRRASSLTSHPTTQGVTLRGIGPAGASRALVLLDGVPLNDPFGGWVNWLSLDGDTLDRIELTRGGGAGPFGNAALGGTLQLFSKTDAPSALTFTGGGHELRDASLSFSLQKQNWTARLSARDFHGPRLDVLRADQRGPVDEPAYADQRSQRFQLSHRTGSLSYGLALSAFEETRGNGTPLARNSTDALDWSLWLGSQSNASDVGLDLGRACSVSPQPEARNAEPSASPDVDFTWEARVWRQRRDFTSTFTAVDAARTSETLSLDQYDVPATGLGASLVARQIFAAHRVLYGLDAREANGVTHEFFRNLGGGFTRDREAGARQRFYGVFAEDTFAISPRLRATLGARYDRWTLAGARRIERDRASGVITREERPADREGDRFNLRAGTYWNVSTPLVLKAAAYTGYRVPTLNELYRPFRVRNDTTEANPALRPEKLRGAELGLVWRSRETWSLEATAYQNRIEDLIANATLATGPATVPGFDPVPAGGVLRQRQNLGSADVLGFELRLAATPHRDWATQLWLAQNSAEWTSGALAGLRLAQTPRFTAGGGATWTFAEGWKIGAQARMTDRQFEDDFNTRRLGRAVVADVFLGGKIDRWLRVLSPKISGELRLGLDNVTDEEIETAKTADGLVSIGAPRQWSLSARLSW